MCKMGSSLYSENGRLKRGDIVSLYKDSFCCVKRVNTIFNIVSDCNYFIDGNTRKSRRKKRYVFSG
ncbi:SWPV2-ORF216 [Shearwaterpox virus]|uniref:SWPV2-ORF216 n=1 Tax=Shearwaterpox virus TaxID=1974596 RepID=A0A1V0QGH8_CNPV|nr:SWPV2-ORF216 [Shearwaterpox virus]QRM15862.1 hypothetical protein [Penguinpox virus 2]QRM16199.1 hypothetical protein [Albatrosspox virus]